MTADTTFWVASCTKLLTTISALQCVEAGQLDLDEDVSTILPEWKQPEILNGFDDAGEPQLSKATKPITLRQLLTHSSGMGYDFLSPSLRRWREWRGQEIGPNPGNIVSSSPPPWNCFSRIHFCRQSITSCLCYMNQGKAGRIAAPLTGSG